MREVPAMITVGVGFILLAVGHPAYAVLWLLGCFIFLN